MYFEGQPSDSVPQILATGETDAEAVFISLLQRDPDGRDAAYLEWHSLDHRPEQYRIAGIRNAIRVISTPECRAARAASAAPFDAVDHVMTYQFADAGSVPPFVALGGALHDAGRMPHPLPSAGLLTGKRAGKLAAPRVVVGADVIPWRPAQGIYLIIEEGYSSPEELIDVPGVAGIWWYRGGFHGEDSMNLQITYCFLDEDPISVAATINDRLRARWASGTVTAMLAGPFHTVVPFDWSRYLPG